MKNFKKTDYTNMKKDLKEDIDILKLKEQKSALRRSLKKGSFSKKTICFCIGFISIFALLCLFVQYKTNNDTHYLLQIISAVFGGELLMLLFKRLWSTDDEKTFSIKKVFNKKQNNKNKESSSIELMDNESTLNILNENIENDGGTG